MVEGTYIRDSKMSCEDLLMLYHQRIGNTSYGFWLGGIHTFLKRLINQNLFVMHVNLVGLLKARMLVEVI